MIIIKTENLSKKFGDFTAVDKISFEVNKGEVFGFLGPNGAGKTTTIKMLITLLTPTDGTAEVAGFNILKQKNEVRSSIGVVFQEPALDPLLTGRENLDYHACLYGIHKEKRNNRIKTLLELVDLEDKKDVQVKDYSGGMKRRLEIARGLMHYPKVLFLDEPTLGLDSHTRRAIWKYIKEMNEEHGTTIFLTTHYMEEADYLCDRIGIIDHGKIMVIDKNSNLKNSIGKDVITLSCSDMNKLIERLKKEKWITNIKKFDDFLTLGVEIGEEKIPLIIDIARSLNINIKSISVRKPTLEDVFLSVTGRQFRDQETENRYNKQMVAKFMKRF